MLAAATGGAWSFSVVGMKGTFLYAWCDCRVDVSKGEHSARARDVLTSKHGNEEAAVMNLRGSLEQLDGWEVLAEPSRAFRGSVTVGRANSAD